MAVPDPYDVVTASFTGEDGAARTPAVLKLASSLISLCSIGSARRLLDVPW